MCHILFWLSSIKGIPVVCLPPWVCNLDLFQTLLVAGRQIARSPARLGTDWFLGHHPVPNTSTHLQKGFLTWTLRGWRKEGARYQLEFSKRTESKGKSFRTCISAWAGEGRCLSWGGRVWAGAKSPSSFLLGFNLSLNGLILFHLSNLSDMASSYLAHAAFLQADEGLNTPVRCWAAGRTLMSTASRIIHLKNGIEHVPLGSALAGGVGVCRGVCSAPWHCWGPGCTRGARPTAAALPAFSALPAAPAASQPASWGFQQLLTSFRCFLSCVKIFISEIKHFFLPLGITQLCILSSGFAT